VLFQLDHLSFLLAISHPLKLIYEKKLFQEFLLLPLYVRKDATVQKIEKIYFTVFKLLRFFRRFDIQLILVHCYGIDLLLTRNFN
jgi:hypothetical protein